MRTESANYKTERQKWLTQPQFFLRPAYVRKAGDTTEYPFARDLSSGEVVSSTTPKLACVKTISGVAQQTDPIAGRSSIGYFEAHLGDISSHAILRQVADPARPLTSSSAITAGGPTFRNSNKIYSIASVEEQAVIAVDDITGYPDMGHLIIDDEDFSYTGRDTATHTFLGVRQAARGTTPAAHPVASLVRNGEQLRRGTRLTLFVGYAPMAEADYGPGPGYTKMEVQSIASQDFSQTWVLRCSDIQRFTKRRVFTNASEVDPSVLGPEHGISLMLRVLTSTGNGLNGPYDTLDHHMGAAVPYSLIDVATFEYLRGLEGIAGVEMQFAETEAMDVKEWVESQILRPYGIIPFINQSGQYSGRLTATATFASAAGFTSGIRATS